LREFLSFGIVYTPDIWSRPMRVFPDWAVFGALALSIGLLVRGLNVRPTVRCEPDSLPLPSRRPLCLAAVGMTVVMVGLALLSLRHIKFLLPVSVFPVAALALLPAVAGIGPHLRWIDALRERLVIVAAFTSPVAILALVPLLMVFVASFFRPMVDAQAMLVFVPYLLIVLAAGARHSSKNKALVAALTIAIVSLFSASVWHFHTMPSSPRDYAAITKEIKEHLGESDVIFVRPRKWFETPLFYYLDPSRLVATDYAASIAERPHVRVWVVVYQKGVMDKEMEAALDAGGFSVIQEVKALGSRGLLYERHFD
jgi:hypothetical protein